ncbi:monofunctional biosynthetic peptidoglycan transglycosylase [Marinomonas posidonica]|uniref:Biosynthetic peptidoglycan transglycosylase n=1 Tax=Marinomonas posidonica (strain CECT 7376 / NCIMB 14433 / IVIA-Po-181) TaxID=491952 RepID=F6CWG4_MARPP|nr:monofunctional biosynthetic peptidoglycan transglycosylase [Marinomonas posidonica]AEF53219.1 Monofunctional biosynthetic peptidoglycan transglycosylase [Marinomonas posidonica IVIA-Po-181]
MPKTKSQSKTKHSVLGRLCRSLLSKFWALFWRGLLLLILVTVLFRFVPLPTTAFMLQSDYPVKQEWISIDKLPNHVALAMVASEDQRFPKHYGVDFAAIRNALKQYFNGNGLRGASTITQQTAKNIFLWPGQSFLRKSLEAGLALGLEALWGKKRILEVYLNVAEFGKGIYGVEAASQHYFGRSAERLTKDQAARLAVLLPSPRTRDPVNLTRYLRKRSVWVELQMRQLGSHYLAAILKN